MKPLLSCALPLALALALAGCSSTTAPPADAGDSGTATPDGGGVCCPIEVSSYTCSPGDRLVGGWAATRSDCHGGGYDGPPYARYGTDEHGCPYLAPDPCLTPCGVTTDGSTWTPPAESTADAGTDGG